MKNLILFVLLAITAFSCENNELKEGIFKLEINSIEQHFNKLPECGYGDFPVISDNLFSLLLDGDSFQFSLGIANHQGTGVYNIGEGVFISIYQGDEEFNQSNNPPGTISITYFDTKRCLVSGNFNTTLSSEDGQVLQVKGSFSKLPFKKY